MGEKELSSSDSRGSSVANFNLSISINIIQRGIKNTTFKFLFAKTYSSVYFGD